MNNVGFCSYYISSVFVVRMMVFCGGGIIFIIFFWGGMFYLFGVIYGVGKVVKDCLVADMVVELKLDNIVFIFIWLGIVSIECIINLIY